MLEGKLGEVVRLVIREVRRAELMLVRMRNEDANADAGGS